MRQLTTEVFAECVGLIEQLRSGTLNDVALGKVAERLDLILPDPNWFAYTIDHEPELPPEEIVQKSYSL